MILDRNLIVKAIKRQTATSRLFTSSAGGLLSDYKITYYFPPLMIPEVNKEGGIVKVHVTKFFEDQQYLMGVNIHDALSSIPIALAREFKSHERFPFPHMIHIFETFIVIEINPESLDAEFLVLSPIIKEENGLDALNSMMLSSIIIPLFSMLTQEKKYRAPLYYEANQLLEYLRTGLGKKKFLGLF